MKNETHKILWDLKIQTDHQILARRSGLVLIEKRTYNLEEFAVPAITEWKQKKTKTQENSKYKRRGERWVNELRKFIQQTDSELVQGQTTGLRK